MADDFRPLHLGTIMRFGSLEFMSLGSGYDMVLLPPRDDTEPRPKPLPPLPVNGRRLGHHAGEPGVGDRGLGSLTPFLGPRHPGPPPACLSSNCPCFWPTMSQGKASQSCKLCPLAWQGDSTTPCPTSADGQGTASAASSKGGPGGFDFTAPSLVVLRA